MGGEGSKSKQSHIPGRLDLTQSVLGNHEDLESMHDTRETKAQAREGDVSCRRWGRGGEAGEARRLSWQN